MLKIYQCLLEYWWESNCLFVDFEEWEMTVQIHINMKKKKKKKKRIWALQIRTNTGKVFLSERLGIVSIPDTKGLQWKKMSGDQTPITGQWKQQRFLSPLLSPQFPPVRYNTGQM